MSLYEHLPSDIRIVVDEFVDQLGPESWPVRFMTLTGWLEDTLGTPGDLDAALLLQQWAGVVTAVLEHLPPDSSVLECQALMSISYNDTWRAQAIALIDRDPSIVDRMDAAYPLWGHIVEGLAAAAEVRPLKKQRSNPI